MNAMHCGFFLKEILHLVAAMVTISERIQVQYLEEKPVAIPQDLLTEFQGHKYLKISPTAYPIVQLVCGGQISRNASLANCPNLTKLLQSRNKAIVASIGVNPEANPEAEQLFDVPEQDSAQSVKAAKKRKHASSEEDQHFVVNIQVESQEVPCLVPVFRPTRASLQVRLEPEPVAATLKFLKIAAKEGLERPTRSYTQKKKAWECATMKVWRKIGWQICSKPN